MNSTGVDGTGMDDNVTDGVGVNGTAAKGSAGVGGVGDGGVGGRSGRSVRRGRVLRTVLAGFVAAAVIGPVSAAASPRVPAPAPAVLADSAGPGERYAANLANLAEAARTAEDAGRSGRAAKLREMASAGAGDARFLTFDGRGTGRAVEVFGDLGTADRIAVLVPGSDTNLDTYRRFRDGALSLQRRLVEEHPRSAVVAWLGYDTPGSGRPPPGAGPPAPPRPPPPGGAAAPGGGGPPPPGPRE
ncbi:alpha/beta hydrolase, partial [Streptomyces sp. NPDC059708]|uniref:alpha/beta hydrolase n=1 Tax=Streptomyces sp. NPDC059708 TaxID=3346916 RepID=UPI00368D2C19